MWDYGEPYILSRQKKQNSPVPHVYRPRSDWNVRFQDPEGVTPVDGKVGHVEEEGGVTGRTSYTRHEGRPRVVRYPDIGRRELSTLELQFTLFGEGSSYR